MGLASPSLSSASMIITAAVACCELDATQQISGFVLRKALIINDGIKKHRGAAVEILFSGAVKLQNGSGDISFHTEDIGDHLLDIRPLLTRRFNGVENRPLTSGDQVIGELGSVLLFLFGLIAEMLGKADQLAFSKPDGSSEIGSSGLTLQVEVSLHEIEHLGGHGLGHGPACRTDGNGDGGLSSS